MQKSLGRGAARYTSRHTAYTAPAAAWWPAPRTLRAGALAAGSSSLPAAALSGAAPAPRQQQLQRGQQRLSAAAAAAVEGVDDAISEEVEAFAVALAKVADDTKAQDLVVLNVAPLVSWTSYFVMCSVVSKPQLLAVLARMEKAAEEDWGRVKQNSPGSSPWEILDYGDVVAHVFTPDQRDHYDIESFYAAAEEVELPFLEARGAADGGGGGGAAAAAPGGGGWSKEL